jgi:hypothetical protein
MPYFSRVFAPAILVFGLAVPAMAQTPPAGAPRVPTVKILAIGEVTGAPLSAELRGKEVRATVNLYLTGKVDQWYLRGDGKGTVFLMNVATEGEAKALLDRLPMSEAGVRKFSYVPLGPMAPLRNLLMAQQER